MLLFWLLRWMERWLRMHIFKVGWLVTKNLRSTTMAFYVLFMPGIIVHELAVYLAASFLNVGAKAAIGLPEAQEVAELKLNFVELAPRIPRWKQFLIQVSPLITGIILLTFISINQLNLPAALSVMRTGDLRDVGSGLALLTSRTDFVLWLYLMFAVANTMIPSVTTSISLRPLLVILTVLVGGLTAAGVISDVATAILVPTAELINTLSAVFGATVLLNGLVTLVLALIENSIEAITGDSAYFRNGRLIAKRRSEIQAERLIEHQRARRVREQAKKRVPGPLEGIPSIYRLNLPIPKASDLAGGSRQLVIEPVVPEVLPPPRHRDPDVISFGDEPAPVVPSPSRQVPLMPPPLLIAAESAEDDAEDESDDGAEVDLYDELLEEADSALRPDSVDDDDSELLD